MLTFDPERIDDQSQRELCMLSSGNQLTWLDLAFFVEQSAASLGEVIEVAKTLLEVNIILPDFAARPPRIDLTEDEIQNLRSVHNLSRNEVRPHLLLFFGGHFWGPLTNRFGIKSPFDEEPPKDLSRRQEIFISENIDIDGPFLRRITPFELLRKAHDPHFGSLAEAFKVARSLADTDLDLSDILNLDEDLLARIDDITLTDEAAMAIRRLFDAIERKHPASVWDLALAASIAEIRPDRFQPVLDLAEHCGGNVARCREFLAFCEDPLGI